MAPVLPKTDPIQIVDQLISGNRIAVFSKTTCPFCRKVGGASHQLLMKITHF